MHVYVMGMGEIVTTGERECSPYVSKSNEHAFFKLPCADVGPYCGTFSMMLKINRFHKFVSMMESVDEQILITSQVWVDLGM